MKKLIYILFLLLHINITYSQTIGNNPNTSSVSSNILGNNNTWTGINTFTGSVSGITSSMVGLGNVSNTSDLNKPISTATQTAFNTKLETIATKTALQSYTATTKVNFDGSEWNKKTGANKASNGGSFAGTIINVDNNTYWERQSDYVTPQHFGAIANGTNDDINAINNAITCANVCGKTVYMPTGIYAISAPILLYPRVKILGTGIWGNGSKIILKANSNCVMLKAGRAIDGTSNSFMAIENIVFDGNSTQQTSESEGVQFWGQYVGSYMKNVFITNVFGVALSLKSGDDVQLDHIWLLGNKSSSGYGMTINDGLTSGYDGTMNFNHIYIEFQRKTTDPTIDVYNAINDDKKSTGLYINRAIICNINDIHFEYIAQGIFLENNATVIIQNCYGMSMGRSGVDNEAMVMLSNGSGARTLKINNGLGISANTTFKWVDMLDKSGSNLNYFLSTPSTTVAGFLTGYTYSNLGANATTKFEADLTVANNITIQGTGNFSPQKLQINSNGATTGMFLKQAGNVASFGSSFGQASDKNFITINSYGNAGDVISLNAPLTLSNRVNSANLNSGNIMLLNNTPAYTFGGNRVSNFVTASSSNVIPSATPDWVGQLYVNTSSNQLFFAKGTTSSADYIQTGDVTTNTSQTISGIKSFQPSGTYGLTVNSGNTTPNLRFFMPANGLEIQTNDSGGDKAILSLFSTASERFRFLQNGNFLMGTVTDVASSKLTISSTTQGILLPRMTTTQRDAIVSPVEGLEIYNLTTHVKNIYNNASWVDVKEFRVDEKLKIATGSNASIGTATLVAGTVTVSTTAVKTGSLVWVQYHGSTSTATSVLIVPTITDSTSFIITAITAGGTTTNVTDTNTVKWWIIN
jgi:hypothetical protein